MERARVDRRLAAILAADVAGYSRLMGADETGTRARFNAHLNELIEPSIASRRGRIVKTTGDGLLVEFVSVVDAVQCAVEIQKGMAERNADVPADRRIDFRIGVNLGDVIIEGDDIHGDGVNVAARLEALAHPGGVVISDKVHAEVRTKLDIDFDDLGPQQVKNIIEPVRAYRLLPENQQVTALSRKKVLFRWRIPAVAAAVLVVITAGGVAWWQVRVPDAELALPETPSIAVLPFANMSDDGEQEYFSDGITEDIITDLSKVSGLFVIARDSSFQFKDKTEDVRNVARDLGVRYVLDGSVRRENGRIRIATQLIDASSGNQIWAERYDRASNDVFAVQDEIAATVVAELAVTLKADEHERLYRRHTESLEAYETFLQAMRIRGVTRNAELRARRKKLFEKVVELDPDFAGGYAGLSFVAMRDLRYQRNADREETIGRARTLARKAIELDDTFVFAYVALADAYLLNRQYDQAIASMEQAVRIQPNFWDAHRWLGFYLLWTGRGEDAIEALKVAGQLNPSSRGVPSHLGMAYFTAEKYEDAIATLEPDYARRARNGTNSLAFLSAAYAATGQPEKARAAMEAFLARHPDRTISTYQHPRTYERQQDRDRYLDLLRQAGMPE